MWFKIECFKCRETHNTTTLVTDGYDNSGHIKLRVVGDDSVEISCKTCGETAVVWDGGI